MSKILFAILMFSMIVGVVYAADNETKLAPNSERSLANFCNTCHGPAGNGPGLTIPFLTGQHKEYLVNSMKEFKSELRHSTMMKKIALGYNDEETDSVATWFSKMKWVNSSNKINKKQAAEGKKLSENCVSCHNAESDSATPIINGQPAEYLYYSLLEYKNKERNNDAGAASMAEVIDMKDTELRELAEYFSSLR